MILLLPRETDRLQDCLAPRTQKVQRLPEYRANTPISTRECSWIAPPDHTTPWGVFGTGFYPVQWPPCSVSQSVSFTQFKSINYESHRVFKFFVFIEHNGQNHGSGSDAAVTTLPAIALKQRSCHTAVQLSLSQTTNVPLWQPRLQLKHRSCLPSGPSSIGPFRFCCSFLGFTAAEMARQASLSSA